MTTKKTKRKAKVRKPRHLKLWKSYDDTIWFDGESVDFPWGMSVYKAKDCRKLAAWLLKAAAYLDSKREGE